MEELFQYTFLSWYQFSFVVILVNVILFLINRFGPFPKGLWSKSIRFHMFIYIMSMIVVVAFLLVRPFINFLLLVTLFGLFYKNIVSYTRSIFSLYYSNVKFGDKIRIGEVVGHLDNINFGGLHLLTEDSRVYFPFNMWRENKIVLESEGGKVPISFDLHDTMDRNVIIAIQAIEKSLFKYPYLSTTDISIDQESGSFHVSARISDAKYKGGLLDLIFGEGFELKK